VLLRAVTLSFTSLALFAIGAPAQERPTFSSSSDLVVVHAMVEDGRGRAVAGLERGNFIVFEDNRPQEISFFSSVDAPASIGLLIDNSTSMIPKRERVIAASVSFTDLSNPEDEIFVLTFNENVREAWPPTIISAGHRDVLRRTLEREISARGKTALHDAVGAALNRLSKARHTRQVLVIISDGSDNASGVSREEMLARTQASSAMIYTVILRDPADPDGNPRLLERLAAISGGESFSPRRADDIPDALEHIARDIRATYTLGYVPWNQERDGKMRKLRVTARDPDGRTLRVQTRGGYMAPKPTTSGGEGRDRAR
jgi:VWFA-related protein